MRQDVTDSAAILAWLEKHPGPQNHFQIATALNISESRVSNAKRLMADRGVRGISFPRKGIMENIPIPAINNLKLGKLIELTGQALQLDKDVIWRADHIDEDGFRCAYCNHTFAIGESVLVLSLAHHNPYHTRICFSRKRCPARLYIDREWITL